MRGTLVNISIVIAEAEEFKKEMHKYAQDNMIRLDIFIRFFPNSAFNALMPQGPVCDQVQAGCGNVLDNLAFQHRQIK